MSPCLFFFFRMTFRIRKPKALTTGNLMIGSLLGVFTGYYAWKLPLQQFQKEQDTKKTEKDKGQE